MTTTPERSPRGGLGRVTAGIFVYALVAPLGMVTLPLASLLAFSSPRTRRELLVTGAAWGYTAWWLITPGALPDQFVRATAVFATTIFVIATLRTKATFTHRALLALTTTALALAGWFLAIGASWDQLRWWVEHRLGIGARTLIGYMWAGDPSASMQGALEQLESSFALVVTGTASLYPAIVALQVLLGALLAMAVYHRVAAAPRGTPVGPFRGFRFSEHLGWAGVISLIVVLIPKLAAAKAAAVNLLLITGALYVVRGVAVAGFALNALGAGVFLSVLLTIILVVMLPVALGSALILGVLDAGLDLRRRWAAPRLGE